jgi:hypothetical protein
MMASTAIVKVAGDISQSGSRRERQRLRVGGGRTFVSAC